MSNEMAEIGFAIIAKRHVQLVIDPSPPQQQLQALNLSGIKHPHLNELILVYFPFIYFSTIRVDFSYLLYIYPCRKKKKLRALYKSALVNFLISLGSLFNNTFGPLKGSQDCLLPSTGPISVNSLPSCNCFNKFMVASGDKSS